jgi:hypothetical protein
MVMALGRSMCRAKRVLIGALDSRAGALLSALDAAEAVHKLQTTGELDKDSARVLLRFLERASPQARRADAAQGARLEVQPLSSRGPHAPPPQVSAARTVAGAGAGGGAVAAAVCVVSSSPS